MIFDWLYRLIYWREIRDSERAMLEAANDIIAHCAEINRRIEAIYSSEEWAALEARCEEKLRAEWTGG